MPELDFEAKAVVPAAEMTMTKVVSPPGEQASESYRLRAQGDQVLGAGGETRAFGKMNLDPVNDDLGVAVSVAGASSPLFYKNQAMNVDHELGGDRNLLTRAVASSQLDRHIGLNILAEEKFGHSAEGRLMGVSIQVDGAGMNSKYDVDQNGEQVEVHGFLGLNAADTGHTPSPALQNANIPDHIKGYASPDIQKGLSDLEVMDYISGQIDRHPGNIFINPETGQVKGIDNDLAFPEQDRAAVLASDSALRAKMVQSLPMTIHQDTAAKIAAVDPQGMRAMLENVTRPDGAPGLSQHEIIRSVNRLTELQSAIANPASVPGFQVVAEFNDQTFLQAVATQKATFQNQHVGEPGQDSFDTMDGTKLGTSFRSSYVGAVLMAEKEKIFAIGLNPDGNTIRPANTITPVARDPQYVEFAKMVQTTQETLKANPQLIADPAARQQVTNLKQQIADTKEKIAHYDKETAGLESNRVGSMLRSLASGGKEGRKEFYAGKKTAAQQQIATLERQLNQAVANSLPDNLRQGLHADAGLIVQARAQQNNVAQPQNNVAQQQPPNLDFLNHPAPQPPNASENNVAQQQPPNLDFLNQPAPQPPNAAHDQLDAGVPDHLQADVSVNADIKAEDAGKVGVTVDVKKEGPAGKTSVAEMLKRTHSAPNLGGHKEVQGLGGEEPKPAANSLRASWQPAKPSTPRPGGTSLTSSHH